MEIEGELPPIFGDKICIEQVFHNLLDNALKYLDAARPGHIRITAMPGDDFNTFSVHDNGTGIAEEEKHKVFEIFRRGAEVSHVPGEGMGMAYVRTIVKRHGGTIGFESSLGKGSSFHFTIAKPIPAREAA